jgi:class 3 adenylate cyclase
MPVFIDRHNVEGISPDQLEAAHVLDLALQKEHHIQFLSVWYDEEQGLAFCLARAPDGEAITHLHAKTHGNVPTDVIEVDIEEVKAFLGRTSDPEHNPGAPPMAGIDSAFRVIMFTDLQDSTVASLRYGDRKAFELLRIHDQMAREAIETNNGLVVKHTGDGFLASFSGVMDALKSAVSLQRKLVAHNVENSESPIHVRVGLNAGNPVEHAGDLFGITVQTAARVCNHAQPDQILLTGIVKELCEDVSQFTEIRDAGRVNLKGIVNALQLYEIVWSPSE